MPFCYSRWWRALNNKKRFAIIVAVAIVAMAIAVAFFANGNNARETTATEGDLPEVVLYDKSSDKSQASDCLPKSGPKAESVSSSAGGKGIATNTETQSAYGDSTTQTTARGAAEEARQTSAVSGTVGSEDTSTSANEETSGSDGTPRNSGTTPYGNGSTSSGGNGTSSGGTASNDKKTPASQDPLPQSKEKAQGASNGGVNTSEKTETPAAIPEPDIDGVIVYEDGTIELPEMVD